MLKTVSKTKKRKEKNVCTSFSAKASWCNQNLISPELNIANHGRCNQQFSEGPGLSRTHVSCPPSSVGASLCEEIEAELGGTCGFYMWVRSPNISHGDTTHVYIPRSELKPYINRTTPSLAHSLHSPPHHCHQTLLFKPSPTHHTHLFQDLH